MFDFNKSSRFHRGDQHFFINDEEVSGVQSVVANFSVPMQEIKYLGMESHQPEYLPQGPAIGNVTITTQLISKDFFIDLTGQSGCNGYILRNRKNSPLDLLTDENFSFTSGYLTSYTHRGSIGQTPSIDAQFSVVGKLGRISTGESPKVTSDLENIQNYYPKYPLNIISPGSIEIEGLEESGVQSIFKNNRLISYEVTINTNRNPVYVLGHRYPTQVELNYPVLISCRFALESNDIVPFTSTDFPCAPHSGDITIKLKDKDSGEIVHQYNFTRLVLSAQNFSTSVQGNQKLDLSYKTYINRP